MLACYYWIGRCFIQFASLFLLVCTTCTCCFDEVSCKPWLTSDVMLRSRVPVIQPTRMYLFSWNEVSRSAGLNLCTLKHFFFKVTFICIVCFVTGILCWKCSLLLNQTCYGPKKSYIFDRSSTDVSTHDTSLKIIPVILNSSSQHFSEHHLKICWTVLKRVPVIAC